jgi:prophage tail gpP-like protein
LVQQLTQEARKKVFSSSKIFENRVRDILQALVTDSKIEITWNVQEAQSNTNVNVIDVNVEDVNVVKSSVE